MMNCTVRCLALIFAACLFAQIGCQSSANNNTMARGFGWSHYGEKVETTAKPVAISTLAGGEKDTVLRGTISEVCLHKGCWMTLRDEHGDEVFVMCKDHSFFVPRNAAGREIVVHGWAERSVVSVDALRHFAEDAGRSAQEIAMITEPQERITFYADSVLIKGFGLEKPHTE